jgi:hypothetical protein
MNPSVNNRDEGMTDRLLFEYLEGELSPERAKALEERLAADPALRGELELWQASFVEPDFYNTQALEKGLVKAPVKVPGSAASGWMLGLVLLVTSFLLAPLVMEKEPSTVRERVATVAAGAAGNSVDGEPAVVKNRPNPPATPGTRELSKVTRRKTSPGREASEKRFAQTKQGSAFLTAEIRPLTPIITPERAAVPADLSAGRVKVLQVQLKKVTLPKVLSRRQQRAIARMKERARQQREANKFLKGNIPYVVPLNSNSF